MKEGLANQPRLVSLIFEGDLEIEDLFEDQDLKKVNLSRPFEGHLSFLNTLQELEIKGRLTGMTCGRANCPYFWRSIVPVMPKLESIIIDSTTYLSHPSELKKSPKLHTISISAPNLHKERSYVLKKANCWVLDAGDPTEYIRDELQKLNFKYELSLIGEAAYEAALGSSDYTPEWNFFDPTDPDQKHEATKVAHNLDLMISEKIDALAKIKTLFSNQNNITEKGTHQMIEEEYLNYASIRNRMLENFKNYFQANNG